MDADEVEFPDGLSQALMDGLWPFNTERQEMWDGCPHWSGGPFTPADCRRAERLLRGWTAMVGRDCYQLVLVPPGKEAVWEADGYFTLEEAPAHLQQVLQLAFDDHAAGNFWRMERTPEGRLFREYVAHEPTGRTRFVERRQVDDAEAAVGRARDAALEQDYADAYSEALAAGDSEVDATIAGMAARSLVDFPPLEEPPAGGGHCTSC